jgi:acyl carrier protein
VSDHSPELPGDLAADLVAYIATDVAPDATGLAAPLDVDTDLLLTGLVDSLGVVRIVHWLEERFDVEIDAADVTLDNFQTVGAMVRYVGERTASLA